MNNKMTELVFILDRSGSMSGLESETIGGFNSMLKKHKNLDAGCRITTVLFDNQYELLHDRLDIRQVAPITKKEYYVRGFTALLDAIGTTINRIKSFAPVLSDEPDPRKVLFVIITDGAENASRQFTLDHIRALIELQQSVHGWQFIFLGANIDAIATAREFGISEDAAQNFHADSRGTKVLFDSVSDLAVSFCAMPEGAPIDRSWKKKLNEDFSQRSSER